MPAGAGSLLHKARSLTHVHSAGPNTAAGTRLSQGGRRGRNPAVRHRAEAACFKDSDALESARPLIDLDFEGLCHRQGLSVGESKDVMMEDADTITAPILPSEKPRYLMAWARRLDIIKRHRRGRGHVRLRPAQRATPATARCTPRSHAQHQAPEFAEDDGPLGFPPAAATPAARSPALYLRHLYVSQELLSFPLNLHPQPDLLPSTPSRGAPRRHPRRPLAEYKRRYEEFYDDGRGRIRIGRGRENLSLERRFPLPFPFKLPPPPSSSKDFFPFTQSLIQSVPYMTEITRLAERVFPPAHQERVEQGREALETPLQEGFPLLVFLSSKKTL